MTSGKVVSGSDPILTGILVCFPIGLICVFIMQAVLISPNVEVDRPNWETAVVFDLPVNVTREIVSSSTTFIYHPRGDERAVFYKYEGAAVLKSETILKVKISAESVLKHDPWPSVGLKVIRNNGSVEEYQLPIRGGNVKGEF